MLCTKVRAGDLPDGSAAKHACAAQNHGAKDEVGDICAGGEENIEKFEAAGRGFLICLYHTLEFSGIQWLNPVKIPI